MPSPANLSLPHSRPLGSRGIGAVYRAEDTSLHRTVALKFLPESVAHTEKIYECLKREACTASALNHPNICTIYEVGEDSGEMFIAMEYIEGRTLSELIRQGPLPIEKVLRYSSQISSALAHAHEKGVIHGDLKPLNIRRVRGAEVVEGIASLHRSTVTPYPCQLRGRPASSAVGQF
jgi:serine/threonine protein kinase